MSQVIMVQTAVETNIARPLGWKMQSERSEQILWLEVIVWIITVGSPLLGFFVDQVIGVVVGLGLSIATQIAGQHAVTKVIETRSGSGRPFE